MGRCSLILFISLISTSIVLSQTVNQTNRFFINGQSFGKDSGKVVLYYYDVDNKAQADTALIVNERFTFEGTVNIACEALLWTNLQNLNFDDQTVIRLILEPDTIHLSYVVNGESLVKIDGSESQVENEKWIKEKRHLLDLKSKLRYSGLKAEFDSISGKIRTDDLRYIRANNGSFVSGNLLSTHKRRLPIDSLEVYFTLLTDKVKKSNVGFQILTYIYPLTNNLAFREANPLLGDDFEKQLKEIKSIHDISVNDVNGRKVALSKFKGKYILLDFWASWCSPCIENMVYQKSLMENYKGDNIQFIFISIDTDKNDWRDAIHKNNLMGLHVSDLKGFSGLLPIYFKVVTGIPQYILINPQGIVINADAPHPKNPELKRLIDEAIANHK